MYLKQSVQSELVSMLQKLAVVPELRQALFERQRAFVQSPGLVADGRDMGNIYLSRS